MSFSRREFVRGAGAGGVALGLGGTARAIESSLELNRPAQQDGVWIDALGGLRLGPEGFDEVERSGLTMIETTLGAPGDPPFGYEQAVQDIASWHGNFNRYPDRVIHVRRSTDILEAKRTGKIAVMIGFQNATHLQRDLSNVEFFYNLGIRQMQLTYNSLNALGAGCTERVDVGLSDFGVEVVRKMNELGMLVDVSHTGVRSTLDAIDVSSTPIVFSHSNCRALPVTLDEAERQLAEAYHSMRQPARQDRRTDQAARLARWSDGDHHRELLREQEAALHAR